jgi:hypothetical protein
MLKISCWQTYWQGGRHSRGGVECLSLSLLCVLSLLCGHAQHIREVSLNPMPIYVAIKQIFDMCVTEAPIRPVEVQVLDVPDARHQLDTQQIRQSGH